MGSKGGLYAHLSLNGMAILTATFRISRYSRNVEENGKRISQLGSGLSISVVVDI